MPTSTADRPVLVVRRVMPIARERIFAAWLDAKSLMTWMKPRADATATVEVEARVGGKFKIIMHTGATSIEHSGEYLVIDPPSRLSFTWISKNTDFEATVVTVELFAQGGKTEVVLTHRGLPCMFEEHNQGWTQILKQQETSLSG